MVLKNTASNQGHTISVVIPMHNGLAHIARAIGSVYQQTFPPNEIILVDDGSSDGGANHVRRNFPTVKILSKTNSGAGSARNAGIEEAKSDWIAFLDSDDFWFPDHLANAIDVMALCPQASVVSTGIMKWKPHDPLNVVNKKITLGIVNFFEDQIKGLGVITSSTAVVRKAAFETAGKFTTQKIHEDTDMWERLALLHSFAHTSQVTAVYVESKSGATSEYFEEMYSISPDWNRLLYLSRNVDLQDRSEDKRKLERYQNHLRWSNMKCLLLHNEITLGKQQLRELSGSIRITQRFGSLVVSLCPSVVIRFVIDLRNRLTTF
jgi:glycosyltransferase involved in cell wall biosynthesis